MSSVALRVILHPFQLALSKPLVTGAAEVRSRQGFLVELSSDGISGWGEAAPLPGWSRSGLAETEAALRNAVEELAASGEASLQALLNGLSGSPHARAGLAGAWWDLRARRADQTLAAYLLTDRSGAGSGPLPALPQKVIVNALIAASTPAEVEQAAHDALKAGFTTVKLKVAVATPAEDVERIKAARTGLGPVGELRLDANGAWDETTALDVLRQVQHCDIAYCEEPVAGVDAMGALLPHSPVPLAADESIRSRVDAERALQAGIEVLIVKPQALGGPDIALEILDCVRQAGARATVTSFLDSAVGLAHALQVAAVADTINTPQAHGLATAALFAADVAAPPKLKAAQMHLSSTPGLGISPTTQP